MPVTAERSHRRTELLAAAARLFSERGYHGTSMQHLGDALGLQRGSLYAHIASKQDLLYEIVDQGAERWLELATAMRARPAPAAHRLRSLLVGHIEIVAEHLHAASVFLSEWRYLSPERRADILAKRRRYEDTVRTIVAEGIASGEFRADVDVRFAGRLLLSAANWTYTWYRPDGPLTAGEVGERFADLMLRGLQP